MLNIVWYRRPHFWANKGKGTFLEEELELTLCKNRLLQIACITEKFSCYAKHRRI